MVDTATLAAYLGIDPSSVRRKVARGELKPLGQFGRGGRGRPGWFFDLDNLHGGETMDRMEPHEDMKIVSFGPVLYPPHPAWAIQSVTPVESDGADTDERGVLDDHEAVPDIGI